MRTRIKFCGLVRPCDVDDAVAAGADLVGFVLYERSPRALGPQAVLELRRRLPSYVGAVGLFVNAPPQAIVEIRARARLDLVQLHGDEPPATGLALAAAGIAYWRAVRVCAQGDLLESVDSFGTAEAFLLDSHSSGYGGSGAGFDWSLVPTERGRPIVLSGGLDEGNVAEGIVRLRPMAVDVSSGIQGAGPREKSAERMARFVAAVRAGDTARWAEENREAL